MAPWWPWSSQAVSKQQPPSEPLQPPPPLSPETSNLSPNPNPTVSSGQPVVLKKNKSNASRKDMPSSEELKQIAAKALQTGSFTGGIGLLVGAGSGILRSAPPTLFALFAGFQWFALGSSYMAAKGLLHHAWGGEENLSSSDFVKASGAAGGVSGMVGGMIRGPKNVLPGMLVFSALGAGSSFVSQLSQPSGSKENKTSWLDSKWSPMRRLTDKDYIHLLEEKILRLDAEIAIIDESIASIKGSAPAPDAHQDVETK